MSNPRDHSRHPARVPTSDATDSASVPWSGRELSPSGFETDTGDGFREPGFSKERRLEPQITVGLLTDASGAR